MFCGLHFQLASVAFSLAMTQVQNSLALVMDCPFVCYSELLP